MKQSVVFLIVYLLTCQPYGLPGSTLNSILYGYHTELHDENTTPKGIGIFSLATLESYITQPYEGWNYHKFYVPNSAKNVVVLEKDAKGVVTKVRGEYLSNMRSPQKECWIEIYFAGGEPFGVKFSEYPDTFLAPKLLNEYSDASVRTNEIIGMEVLQSLYFYNLVNKKYSKFSTDYFNLKHLVSSPITTTERRERTEEYMNSVEPLGGSFKERIVYYDVEVKIKGWRNTSNHPIIFKRINRMREYAEYPRTGLKFKDTTVMYEAGAIFAHKDFHFGGLDDARDYFKNQHSGNYPISPSIPY
jgi:hypothetical protein